MFCATHTRFSMRCQVNVVINSHVDLLTINKEMRRVYSGVTVLKERSQAPGRASQNSSCGCSSPEEPTECHALPKVMEKAHVLRRELFKADLQETLHAEMFPSSSSNPLSRFLPHNCPVPTSAHREAGERRGPPDSRHHKK